MVSKVSKVMQSEEMNSIYEKKFYILKEIGEGNISLMLSVTIGYFDALVISKNTQYYNSTFIQPL
jgi:hypothetical protein